MRKCLIFVLAVAFVAACGLPAMAQEKEVNLYGSVRMETFYRSFSQELAANTSSELTRSNGLFDTQTTQFEIGDSSRFGANFKAGNISANVELRPQGGGEGGSGSSNFRQWWGQVDFSGWSLRAGQQSVIDGMFPPGCCIDEGSVQSSFGGWSGRVRQPGISAFIPVGQGTLAFGLFAPGELDADQSGATTAPGSNVFGWTGTGINSVIPQIQASFDINLGPAALKFVGGYNTYDETYWQAASNDTTDYSIDAWIIGGQVEANAGPFTIMFQAHYVQNSIAYRQAPPGALGLPRDAIGFYPMFNGLSNSIEDDSQYGFFGRLIYKMSDLVSWELGGGYAHDEQDQPVINYVGGVFSSYTGNTDTAEQDVYYIYLNAQIFLAKTFRFTPEVGYFGLGDKKDNSFASQFNDISQGDSWYAGAYWRIDF